MKKEALLYETLEKNIVHCFLCAHQCRIAEDKFGFCGVRQNLAGKLFTFAYGEVITAHVDPIEKKPLYHFLPGTKSFSVATIGCNFRCSFCQNWQISQQSFRDGNLGGEKIFPQGIVELALKNKCRSISYTYTEPTIFFEYAFETAKLAHEKGLYNIFVTNGFMTRECIELAQPYLDAANIDLKFFKQDSYKRVCSGSLQPVLDSIKLMHKLGIWVEVTTLVIPGENDSEEELSGIAKFISGVSKDMPWHISAFHPDYKFSEYNPTPQATLKKAYDLGKNAGLNFVYVGNVLGWDDNTYCPSCKKVVVEREGFSVLGKNIKQDKCGSCGIIIPGLFGDMDVKTN
ncbi:MAG: AmmeMemoRadiSam system radical SAM enzyme [Candidatus Omnitrophica bacterium]|nr:AmmeMemoRadiSam system radical SAM enzyme [Candidatus Omnitrophota bacterium]